MPRASTEKINFHLFFWALLIPAAFVLRLLPELSNPRFSWIGDELSFYEVAVRINRSNLLVNPFASGAHGYCSNLVSLLSAAFLKVFGETMFWWRFSTVLVLPISTMLLYLWVRRLYDERVAFLSSCVFCSSFCFQNFFVLGYGNQLTFIPFLLLNLLLTSFLDAPEKRRIWAMIGAGAILGLGFYFYIGIVLPFVCLPYWAILWRRHGLRASLAQALGTFLFAIPWLLPLIYDNSYARSLLEVIAYHNSSLSTFHRIPMMAWTFLAFFHSSASGYFVAGSYVDKLSAALLACGILVALARIRRTPSHPALLMELCVLLIPLGLSHRYDLPPIQHNFLLIAITSAFSGLGLAWIADRLPERSSRPAVVFILLSIVLANQFRRELAVYIHGVSPETCILMNVKAAKEAMPGLQRITVISNEPAYSRTAGAELLPRYGANDIQLDYEPEAEPKRPVDGLTVMRIDYAAVQDCRKKAVPAWLLNSFGSWWAKFI